MKKILKNSILQKSTLVQAMLTAMIISSGGGIHSFAFAAELDNSKSSEQDDLVDTGVSKTEVPTTKQLITRSAFEQSLASDGSEAVKDVAGVSSSTSQGAANPATSIRGLQLNLYSNYRLNGGLPTTGVVSVPMENKEAVEVLKGANSLQFGLANPAGIINYVTKRAKDKDVTSVGVNGNSFGQYGVAVDLGRKFGESREFGLRVNAAAQHLESGVKDANGHGEFFSIAGDWQATKDLAFKVDYENISKDVIEQAQIKVANRSSAGVVAVPKPPDPTVLLSGPWAFYRPRTENFDVKAEYKISPKWRMLAEYGQSNSVRLERMTDQISFTDAASVASGLGKDGFNLAKDQRYDNTFYRTEFQGQLSTAGYEHDLTLGYSNSERKQNIANTVTAISQSINIYSPTLRATAPVPPTSVLPGSSTLPTVSSDEGPYAYDTIKLNDKVKVTVGVRLTKYFYSANPSSSVHTEKNYDVTSPATGLSYDFAPRSTVYASVMSSFEDGGAAPAGTTNQYQILEPTKAKQREFGFKTSYWSGVKSSVTYFNIERANNITVTNSDSTKTFIKDGNVDYEGIETTHSFTFNKNWGMDIAGQWLKALQQPDVNLPLDGKRPPGIPTLSGNLRISHTSTDIPGLKLNVGFNAMGSKFVDSYESGSISGYAVYSAGGSYSTTVQGRKTVFTTQIDNLSDLSYWSGVNGTTYAVGSPRSIKFNMKMDF